MGMLPLFAADSNPTATWILTTISTTGEGIAVLKVWSLIIVGMCAFNTFLLVFTLFWLKKKFREAGELFMAARVAHLAAQVEKDMTRNEVAKGSRAVEESNKYLQVVAARMDDMRQATAQIKETVAAVTQSTPTVLVTSPTGDGGRISVEVQPVAQEERAG